MIVISGIDFKTNTTQRRVLRYARNLPNISGTIKMSPLKLVGSVPILRHVSLSHFSIDIRPYLIEGRA